MKIKQGTWSVLFGCHSIIHSILVTISWMKLYKRPPNYWQLFCIFIHDIGHWGKDYLDDLEQKRQHWQLGAEIARRLFGDKAFRLVAGHVEYSGYPESLLLKPDKYSMAIAPKWWLFTNLIVEPKIRNISMSRWEHLSSFRREVRKNISEGKYISSHDIYLEQDKRL